MSVAEFPPRVAAPTDAHTETVGRRRFTLTLEQAVYLLLFGAALLIRIWGVGDRAFHHDETHHGHFSWQLYTGGGYVHDPLLHGPFLYYITAFFFFLFGDNDTTARLSTVLFGSVLVVLPYFIRRELGRSAALLAAAYLLFAPAFLYVSRFIRHDTFAITFELLAFIGIVRYASTRRARWLYVTAAALALMFTTMETFFLYVVIFGSLLILLFLWRVWRPGLLLGAVAGLTIAMLVFVLPGVPIRGANETVEREQGVQYTCPSTGNLFPSFSPMRYEPGPIFGMSPLETFDNNFALCVRHQPDNDLVAYAVKLGQFFRHPLMIATLSVFFGTLAAFYRLIWRRRGADRLTAWERARATGDGTLESFASLATGRRVLIALAVFFILYALFFSAFLTNPAGAVTGTTGSLLYWLAQHEVERGNQPDHYYFVLLALYEPLVLLWGLVGTVMVGFVVGKHLSRRASEAERDETNEDDAEPFPTPERPALLPTINWQLAMPVMLVWWAGFTVFIYSWAGEKMPWLTTHVALPVVLLGAWALARTLRWGLLQTSAFIQPSHSVATDSTNGAATPLSAPHWRPLIVYLGLFAVIVMYAFLLLTIVTSPNDTRQGASVWVPPLAFVAIVALTVCYGLVRRTREAIGALALGLTLTLTLYTARSSYQLNYLWGDVPREMMIYTQTTPDVERVIDRLEEVSIKRTGGMDMPIWYDNETIWSWYMRDFTNGQEQSPALTEPPGEEVMAVLMLQQNIDTYPQNLTYLQEAGFRIQRYPLRWWFPENDTYRVPPDWTTAQVTPDSALLMRLLRTPNDGETIAQFWRFLIHRQTPKPLGSTDFILAVRPEIVQDIGLGTGAETP